MGFFLNDMFLSYNYHHLFFFPLDRQIYICTSVKVSLMVTFPKKKKKKQR